MRPRTSLASAPARSTMTLFVLALLVLAGCGEAPTEWREANPTVIGGTGTPRELDVEVGSILLESTLTADALQTVLSGYLEHLPADVGPPAPDRWDPRYTRVPFLDATPQVILQLIESLRRDPRIAFAAPCYSAYWGLEHPLYGYIERSYHQPLNGLHIQFYEGTSRLAMELVLEWIGGNDVQRPDPGDRPRSRQYRVHMTFPHGADPIAVASQVDRLEIVEWAEGSWMTSWVPLSASAPDPDLLVRPSMGTNHEAQQVPVRFPSRGASSTTADEMGVGLCG
jgi:hypothetical protein